MGVVTEQTKLACGYCGAPFRTKQQQRNIRVTEQEGCLRLCDKCAAAHDAVSGNWYDQLLKTANALNSIGMQARHLLADWPGTNDEQRRIDWPEFAALEYLATDALSQAERLMALHEREEI